MAGRAWVCPHPPTGVSNYPCDLHTSKEENVSTSVPGVRDKKEQMLSFRQPHMAPGLSPAEGWTFFSFFYENQVKEMAEGNAEPLGSSGLCRPARTTILSGAGRSEDTAFLGREEKAAVAGRPDYAESTQDTPGDAWGSSISFPHGSWPHSPSLRILGTRQPSDLANRIWDDGKCFWSTALRTAVKVTRPHSMVELQGGQSLGPPMEDSLPTPGLPRRLYTWKRKVYCVGVVTFWDLFVTEF